MVGEIAAIIAGVNAATSAIKSVAETSQDLQSISGFLSSLGSAEVELARKQNEGKLSEADAVKAALAKKQIQETMSEIKDLFLISGNSQLYAEAMTAMAEARKAKQRELAQKEAARRQLWRDVRQLAAVTVGVLLLLPLVLYALLQALTS